ncbi:hypothetical protein Dimus_033994 [Dionaea muscipula]
MTQEMLYQDMLFVYGEEFALVIWEPSAYIFSLICRQKTRELTAECKNVRKYKPCPMKYCHKCLRNRYAEDMPVAAAKEVWHCPKCRDICNCSFCMKKKGLKPTGSLLRTAKVSLLSPTLEIQGPYNALSVKDGTQNLVSPNKLIYSDEGQAAVAPSKHRTENDSGGASSTSSDSQLLPTSADAENDLAISTESRFPLYNLEVGTKIDVNDIGLPGETSKEVIPEFETDDCEMKQESQDIHLDITLPEGIEISKVADIYLPPEDVGGALQFMEFCATFGEILGIKKGQAECVIQDIMGGGGLQHGECSSAVLFQIQLLTFLQKDLGEESPSLSPSDGNNCWLKVLRNFLPESECEIKNLVNCIDESKDGYDILDCSHKLKLLTFLCDETLGTMEMRNWIEDQNIKFSEKRKEARGKVATAKREEMIMKQKLQDEIDKAILAKNGASLTISEHESIVSEIKAEASKAHDDILEARGLVPKRKQRSDAMRTETMFCDTKGRVFWRLKGYNNSQIVALGWFANCYPLAFVY